MSLIWRGEREYWEQRIVMRERKGGKYEVSCVGETESIWWRWVGRDWRS